MGSKLCCSPVFCMLKYEESGTAHFFVSSKVIWKRGVLYAQQFSVSHANALESRLQSTTILPTIF